MDGRREFCAPYPYSAYPKLPGDLFEATENGFAWPVLGRNVAVRERPDIRSRIIARLDYNLVPVLDVDAPDNSGAAYVWQMVILPTGRLGYVEASLLWGPHRDWHLCFAQFGGSWKVSLFDRLGFRFGR
jgi:hypothetical protein